MRTSLNLRDQPLVLFLLPLIFVGGASAAIQFETLGTMPTSGSSVSALPDLMHADVNGDGHQDLVYFNNAPSPGRICVALSNGSTLSTSHVCSPLVTSEGFGGVALGDVNSDGRADAVVGNSNADGANVEILLGTAGGGFVHFASLSNGTGSPPSAGLADFNHDGNLDLVGSTGGGTPQLTVRLGNGNGTFGAPIISGATTGTGGLFLAGDINADGNTDVIYLRDHSPSGLNSVSTHIRVNLGHGNGQFTDAQAIIIPTTLVDARLTRIDTDARPDLMVYGYKGSQNNSFWGGVFIFTSATGLLQQSFHVGWLDLPYPANGAEAADLDGDQRAELILVRQSTSAQDVIIWPNVSTGPGEVQFNTNAPVTLAGLDYARQVVAFNFGGSDLPDLVVHDMPLFGSNALLMCRNTTAIAAPGDITGDGVVNVNDLLAVINAWGNCPAPPAACPADIAPPGGDGVVNVNDLLMVINNWG